MRHRSQQAAHDGQPGKLDAVGDERRDVGERADRRGAPPVGVAECAGETGVVAPCDWHVDELVDPGGSAFVVTVGGADADQLDSWVGGHDEEGHGVVGVVTDVGVDPDPHRELRRLADELEHAAQRPVERRLREVEAVVNERLRHDSLTAEQQVPHELRPRR